MAKLNNYNLVTKTPTAQCVVPVTFILPSTGRKFTLPIDPLVSVSQKNNISCKSVAKFDGSIRGTIKERWAMTDYDINISGVLIGDDNVKIEDYILQLRQYTEAGEAVGIVCPYINDSFDLTKIVIESCNFPFTQGENCQQYSIKAKSDDEYDLLS